MRVCSVRMRGVFLTLHSVTFFWNQNQAENIFSFLHRQKVTANIIFISSHISLQIPINVEFINGN